VKNVFVYYTHRLPDIEPDRILPDFTIVQNESRKTLTKSELIREAKAAHAICWFVPDVIDEEVIASCPNLLILAGFGRGHNNIDVAAATQRNVWVTVGPETMADPVADLTWGLILSVARRIAVGDRYIRATKLSGWHPTRCLGYPVSRKSLGIIGMGKLGKAIARRSVGFEMNLLYCETGPVDEAIEKDLNMKRVSLDQLLRMSDFICVAAPLAEGTYHYISARELSMMKPTAILINTARGSEVDEVAVADALDRGLIAGYAADVFEMEDREYSNRPAQVTSGLVNQADLTLLTPHISTAVNDMRIEIATYQALNVIQALKGERPIGAVNDIPLQPALLGIKQNI
jgi:phosphonate dehydrogenase